MRRKSAWTLLAGVLAAASVPPEVPRPLAPLMQSIFPRGGRQGSEVEVTVHGKNLEETSQVRISGGGVAAEILDAADSELRLRVSIAPTAPIGRRDLRVLTPQGSFVQVFEIGSLPEQFESEPNDDWVKATPISLPVIINGKITAGDYDHFRFHAQAGQTLVFDLNSSRNGTRFDGVLSLLDGKGREIAFQDDYYFDKDPHLVYRFRETGDYVVRVNGFREAGSAFSEYRLMMGEVPSLSYVFPAGGRRGHTVQCNLSGYNLQAIDGFVLGDRPTRAEILERATDRLKVRLSLAPDLSPGFYPLRVRLAQTTMPNPLIFAISDVRELTLDGPARDQRLWLDEPVVVNGRIAVPGQRDNFRIEAAAGEQITLESDAMKLGNFLDPAVTLYNDAGEVVVYMDETAPNGFDKEPPQLDFYLLHQFERAGRYRIEMRDAGLRGRDEFVYRLTARRAHPEFQVMVLTNQLTLLPSQPSMLPVRVRRRGGWNTPVEVWVEGLPQGVKSAHVTAQPVNTRFRGTFGEDFFFDGTNVDVPLEVQADTRPGAWPIQVKARGVAAGKIVEHAAVVYYPWQQTGYLRGPTDEGVMLLSVARPPLFDVEAPASVTLARGETSEITLKVRWFTPSKLLESIRVEPKRIPRGLTIEELNPRPDEDKIIVRVKAGGEMQVSDRLVLVAWLGDYRKAAPDIAVKRKEKG